MTAVTYNTSSGFVIVPSGTATLSTTNPTPTSYYVVTGGAGGGGSGTGYVTVTHPPKKAKKYLGEELELVLPDGGVFHLEADGSYRLEDKNAKITYAAARNREFNRFLNASDLVAEFIEAVGGLGLKKGDILQIPIKLFIAFLVVRAAETDGEPPPHEEKQLIEGAKLIALPPPKNALHRCGCCGRFIRASIKRLGLNYCSPEHAAKHYARLVDAVPKNRLQQ